jgi:hypothetical protein
MRIRPTLAALLLAAPMAFAAAEEGAALQERVKAAFLAKFPSYVEWPSGAFPAADSPIVIGVLNADSIAGELETAVAGRSVAGRALTVRRIGAGESAAGCCQVLFVGSRADSRAAQVLAQSQGHPVLTVTDRGSDHPHGSVINFVSLDDRVRFDIARDAAERNGLQLRSQLLGVARQVRPQ